eukprot:CAMPEP_0198662970 /NCGR_PEP_ID=MMETSP1467-20131203/49903_1 /TAXON_ID=1462469 /ORGANISM="unid. sp., Strain CCMP2135" /LENGTH=55 /DNA_ID=CAMNT_0044399475 /DNA_START=96 /DNA_END=260 /DNA_ORIENTATION=-
MESRKRRRYAVEIAGPRSSVGPECRMMLTLDAEESVVALKRKCLACLNKKRRETR